jgi:hypothetical protein
MLEYQPDRPFPDLRGISLRCAHKLHPLKKWSLRESRGGSKSSRPAYNIYAPSMPNPTQTKQRRVEL